MTNATLHHRPDAGNPAIDLDPYGIDEMTITLEEWRRQELPEPRRRQAPGARRRSAPARTRPADRAA